MERDFKGIWIPKEIWLSEKMTIQEKLFFIEIDSLDNDDGCFAGNEYFAKFFGISKTRVSLVIKKMIEKGLIKSTIIYKDGTKQILKRVLNICYRPYLTKVKDPIQQKLIDNNTINNKYNIYTENSSSLSEKERVDYTGELEAIVKMWNSIDVSDWKKTRKITPSLIDSYRKLRKKYKNKEEFREDFQTSVNNYISELTKPNAFYTHIFPLRDYIAQGNAFPKFLNL